MTINRLRKPRPWRRVPVRSSLRPLRCMFVITSMPVGGAETLLVNMIRGFDPKQVRAEVVCLKRRGLLGERLADEFPVHANLIRGKWDVRVLLRLFRLFRRRQTDVVITVGAGDKMFWGRLAAWLAGVPVIASALHSTGWPDGVGRLNRLLTPITDAWIAVADAHGKYLSEREKFPEDRVRVIRNGVDCDRFRPNPDDYCAVREELGLPPQTRLVGIVAALRSEKNHSAFVRMAARLHADFPDVHWIVVGDGPEREHIEAEIQRCHLADHVHLLGTRHDTHRLLAALDVFTLCSRNEAFPVSILEALACQVPVVATDVGSVSEAVLEGKTGYLVPTEDVAGLSDAVARLLERPAERRELGVAGRDLVLATGSLEAMIRGYQALAEEHYDRKSSVVLKSAKEATSGFEPLKN